MENLALAEHLGSGTDAPVGGEALKEKPAGAADAVPQLELALEVVWGDVTMVNADVYGVGHYVGVRPSKQSSRSTRPFRASGARTRPTSGAS